MNWLEQIGTNILNTDGIWKIYRISTNLNWQKKFEVWIYWKRDFARTAKVPRSETPFRKVNHWAWLIPSTQQLSYSNSNGNSILHYINCTICGQHFTIFHHGSPSIQELSSVQNPSIIPFNPGWFIGILRSWIIIIPNILGSIIPELIINQPSFISYIYIHLYHLISP